MLSVCHPPLSPPESMSSACDDRLHRRLLSVHMHVCARMVYYHVFERPELLEMITFKEHSYTALYKAQ